MRTTTIESVSVLDIRAFSKEELLSLRDEIDTELEAREKKKESRTPLDLFAQQARRDVCCPICGCHHYYDDGVRNGKQRILCFFANQSFLTCYDITNVQTVVCLYCRYFLTISCKNVIFKH